MKRKSSKMAESIELKIREAYQLQRHQKCVELIDSLPTIIKENSQYRILKASCLNNIPGRSRDALSILDLVIGAEEKPNPLALFGKGLCFINEGNFTEAVKCFERAIELEPSEKMDKARAMKDRAEKMMLNMLAKRKEQPKNEISTCNVCGKVFTKLFSMTRHMLLHTGERPFQCSICHYGFIQKSDLLRHEATHKSEFNFHCLYCTKKFKTKKNLQCHMTTHEDPRPFKCPQCPKAFKLERLLKHHLENHQNLAKTFQCEECHIVFLSREILVAHLEECHPQQEGNIALEPLDIKPDISEIQPMELVENCGNHDELVKVKEEPKDDEKVMKVSPISVKPVKTLIGVTLVGESAKEFETCETEKNPVDKDVDGDNFFADSDPDVAFLRSIIKDIELMDPKQKEEFQNHVRLIIDEILE